MGVGPSFGNAVSTAKLDGIAVAKNATLAAAETTNNAIRTRRSKNPDLEANFSAFIIRRFVMRIRHLTAAVEARNDAGESVVVAASL